MLSAFDLDEYFIDVKGVAAATVLSLKSSGIQCAKLDAPEAD